MTKPSQAVVLCGGLGSRLRPHTDTLPKPMILCNGKPFLWYLLQQLSEQGIIRFVLLTGYLSKIIEDYFNDGKSFGWDIRYSIGPVEWDTGKRIWEAKDQLDDRYILLYSDNFVPYPLDEVLALHDHNGLPLTFMVSKKEPGNISLDDNNVVQRYDNDRADETLKYVEIGYMIVERDRVFDFYNEPNCSFSSVLKVMASKNQITAWLQYDAYHSISDPVRWKKVESYFQSKKILLIDRDGVINQKAAQGEYISTWDEFEWIADTRNALKELAQDGFKFIIISNQAGIARNMIEPKELERIHENMTKELSLDGVSILDIYVCPHHWDDACFCRKPNPGMLLQASKEHLFRLDKTIYIGDDPRDCQCAQNAKCDSIFLGRQDELQGLERAELPIFSTTSLLDVVSKIKNTYNTSNIL